MVIETLAKDATKEDALVFAYCRYSQSYTALEILRGLAKQLLEDHPNRTLPIVKEVYGKHALRQTNLTINETVTLLQRLLASFNEGKVRIIVDGLDEVVDAQKVPLLQSLAKLPNTPLLILSRPLPLFTDFLGRPFATFDVQARNEDIDRFITKSISNHPHLRVIVAQEEGALETIARMVREKSRGM